MTIYKRRKMWWVEYTVDGVRHRQSTHTRDYAVARTWARQIDNARHMPTFEEAVMVLKMFYKKPIDGVLSIDAAWKVYEDLAKALGKNAISEYTMNRRKLAFERFVKWLKKERAMIKTVESVTGPIAAGFATYLATTLKLKSKTRINNISELNTVWKMLENASSGVRNPWGSLRPQDVDGQIGKPFTHEDERLVLEAAKAVGKQWFEICTVMRHTGQRYGDVARLKWSNIDTLPDGSKIIHIMQHKTARHGITSTIPVIRELSDVLDSIQKTGDFVFPMHAELYGCRSMLNRHLPFREVLKAAGLDEAGYTVHSWRHTAATRLAEHGADIETRKALLGHRVDATAERYDHDEHIEAKRDALERAAS